MKLQQAYDLFSLSKNATQEEIKKRYRELSKKMHPDVCKDPDAEEKFKKINEAYQCLQSGKGSDQEDRQAPPDNPFGNANFNINDIFNIGRQHTGRQQIKMPQPVNLHETLTFKESIFGCKKTLNYSRQAKCKVCQGETTVKKDNGCKKCKGAGQISSRQGNMIFQQTCPECHGNVNIESCKTCSSSGTEEEKVSITVSIPGGVVSGNSLRLSGMGNFAGSNGFFTDVSSDAFLNLSVTQDHRFSLQDNDLVFKLKISLLDSLIGLKVKVPTLEEDVEIEIPTKSKHSDIITIPKMGVERQGNQLVVLDLQYPDDVSGIINLLQDK